MYSERKVQRAGRCGNQQVSSSRASGFASSTDDGGVRASRKFSHGDRSDRHLTGSSAESSSSRSMTTDVSMMPALGALSAQARGLTSWELTRSRSARNLARSTFGACRKSAIAVSERTERCRRSGDNSPTGTPFRVTTKDSPSSRRRMISPLSLRRSRWVISLATSPARSTPCYAPANDAERSLLSDTPPRQRRARNCGPRRCANFGRLCPSDDGGTER